MARALSVHSLLVEMHEIRGLMRRPGINSRTSVFSDQKQHLFSAGRSSRTLCLTNEENKIICKRAFTCVCRWRIAGTYLNIESLKQDISVSYVLLITVITTCGSVRIQGAHPDVCKRDLHRALPLGRYRLHSAI